MLPLTPLTSTSLACGIIIQWSTFTSSPSTAGCVACFPCFVRAKINEQALAQIAPQCILLPLWWRMNQSIAGTLPAFITHYHLDQGYHFSPWLTQLHCFPSPLKFHVLFIYVSGQSVSLKMPVCDRHSGALRDRYPVRVKTFWCVLITVGASYVSRSTPDAIVGV